MPLVAVSAADPPRPSDPVMPADPGQALSPRPPLGLYLHIPYCISLCPYCDFVVVTGRASRGPESRIPAFLAALHVELDLRADVLDAAMPDRPPLASVYLGGGTPALLAADQVAGLLAHVGRRYGVASDAEVTLEANPGPAERGDLRGMRAAGVTRLSLGAQSLDPTELRRLGRRHEPVDVANAIAEARSAGIPSVGVDLLMDVPGQTIGSFARTLDGVIALGPDHVSTYQLTLDDPDAEGLTGVEGDHLPLRPGARRWRQAAIRDQDEDRAAELDALASERLGGAGIERYELSNHARPGHTSRHNLAYWRREPVEALGPGAHAFDGAYTRRWNAARLDRYLGALTPPDGSAPRLPAGGTETIDPTTARAEAAILGLRLRSGVDTAVTDDPVLAEGIGWGLANGLLGRIDERLVLTARGRLLSNEVFGRLLPSPQAVPDRRVPSPDEVPERRPA
jgi:oxygen-independent coproporphyrinogen-3 oxidase